MSSVAWLTKYFCINVVNRNRTKQQVLKTSKEISQFEPLISQICTQQYIPLDKNSYHSHLKLKIEDTFKTGETFHV